MRIVTTHIVPLARCVLDYLFYNKKALRLFQIGYLVMQIFLNLDVDSSRISLPRLERNLWLRSVTDFLRLACRE